MDKADWSRHGETLRRFATDTSAATAIEYAMIASGVGAFLASTIYVLGGSVKGMLTTLSNLFQ